jgi:superoxide oxidase
MSDPTARRAPFDGVTIAIHWTTLVLVLGLVTSALMIEGANDPASAKLLFQVHRSLGVTTWTLAAARLVWRLTRATLPPFPATMGPAQRWAARLNEYGLYGLLLGQPVTGLGDTLFRGKPFDLFIWRIPALVARHKGLASGLHELHVWGAVALAALVGLHASAALLHAFVLKDGVFQSMAPIGRRAARQASCDSRR